MRTTFELCVPDTVRDFFEWKKNKEEIPERGGGSRPVYEHVRTGHAKKRPAGGRVIFWRA